MRKSGWAAAAALGSLALLLAGCGGSSSSAGGGSGTTPTAGARPTSEIGITPGDTVLIVQKSKLGYVLALANGDVVYTYGADKKGGQPTCTNSCAAIWPGVTGIPMINSGETLPAGTLGTVTLPDGARQITYDGLPLYYLKSEKPLATTGNGMDGGMWRVIKLSSADITG